MDEFLFVVELSFQAIISGNSVAMVIQQEQLYTMSAVCN